MTARCVQVALVLTARRTAVSSMILYCTVVLHRVAPSEPAEPILEGSFSSRFCAPSREGSSPRIFSPVWGRMERATQNDDERHRLMMNRGGWVDGWIDEWIQYFLTVCRLLLETFSNFTASQ